MGATTKKTSTASQILLATQKLQTHFLNALVVNLLPSYRMWFTRQKELRIRSEQESSLLLYLLKQRSTHVTTVDLVQLTTSQCKPGQQGEIKMAISFCIISDNCTYEGFVLIVSCADV